ncbi:MAG TPA: DUF1127 domain-containing protein [Alphaproteobacteria bacterium]|nr:DUF1127 domain-containing protein [Alphaproteobacteria bacterium]
MNQISMELSSAAGGREPRGRHGGHEIRVGLVQLSQALAHQIHLWRERARQRRELMSLGEEGLKDIGLGQSEAYHEYAKPFWRR